MKSVSYLRSMWKCSGLRICTAMAALPVLLGGCASVDATPDFEQARDEVAAATGQAGLFQPGDKDQVAERISEWMEGGLTVSESVEISLLNNGELCAKLYEIGVRRADAVQAGLLSNPSLQALIRFPFDNGPTTFGANLFTNVIELWQVSPRKRVAQSKLEQTVLAVAHSAASLVAEVKSAYLRASAAMAALLAAQENRATASEFLTLTLTMQDAGASTQVNVNAARSEFLEQEALVRKAAFAVFDTKRKLSQLLGLPGNPLDLSLSDSIADVPAWSLDLAQLLELAKHHRLDLRAAAKAVELADSALELEQRSLFRNINAGLSVEDDGGETQLGPFVRLTLPIFDQNQAQIAKAQFRQAQAQRRLEALDVRVDQQVRGAFEQLLFTADSARLYRDQLLPLRQSSLELARESYTEGKTGFLSVLEAQSRLLVTRQTYIERLEAVALSLPQLEAACGRPLTELVTAASLQTVPIPAL